MQLIDKYKNRIVRIIAGLLMSAAVTGCVNQSQADPVAGNGGQCPAGTTLVCAHRMGEVISCSCKSKAGLEDVF